MLCNGATYKFYDTSKNEITYTDINSLDNAVYYTVDGTGSKDRFYVVAADSSKADYSSNYGVNLGRDSIWGYYYVNTDSTEDGIGKGKTNTAQILVTEDSSGSYEGSIWEWLNDVNSNKYGGCSDWFIGSTDEHDALKSSGKAGLLFNSKNLWSSVEGSARNAYRWYYDSSYWDSDRKTEGGSGVVAFRTLLSEGVATIQGPQKEFAGWWTKDGSSDGDWGTQVTAIKATDMKDMNLYAKWE